MATFAVIDGSNTVVNVILADSQEVAEAATGLTALETTGEPWLGWQLIADQWTRPEDIPQRPLLDEG